ncbi:MAG: protein kinase [Clostridium sp.]|uniref:protein kinase domain-containing protein n=1 Tax=Clostridium sp. TaxID=1506 RepID=UPI0028FE1AA8|nr:protein kinase [Clostridium sp.]MDU1604716.1 protein kinase [Clostridium sp.]
MKKLQVTDNYIIEEIAKAFSGDEKERIDFPYRSGPKLVEFFNYMGFRDQYGQGFQTRWRYAKERITYLFENGRINEFFTLSLSYKEIIKFKDQYENFEMDEVINRIIKQMNREIFKLCGKQLKINGELIELVDVLKDKPIGEGAFAQVYKKVIDGKVFAIKCLKDEYKNDAQYASRFKREYEIMESLNNTGVTIKVFKYSDEDKKFRMEFADKTLKQFIDENYHIMNDPYKEAICEEIIRDMICLHKHNIIHRDLSYNNILYIDNHFKLSDFGLGKNQDAIYSLQTQTEMGVGTAHFIDPIQKQNIKDANKLTDMYSVGQIIDYVFSGSIASIHHKYSGVVNKAINKQADRRYSSVEELLEDFLYVKNQNNIKSPVEDMIEMVINSKYNMGKVYEYLIDRNAGKIVVDLINKNYKSSKEILEQFILQYEEEVEGLVKKMNEYIRNNRLDYSYYDNVAYISYEMITEMDKYMVKSIRTLIDIIYYCGYEYPNRFNVQRFIKNTVLCDNNIKYEYKKILENIV